MWHVKLHMKWLLPYTYKYQAKLALWQLESRGIEIESYNVGQALMILLMDAFNYARTWESKGFRQVDQEATSSNDAQSNQVVVPMINPMKSTKSWT